jgi:dipeptidyl aminopeptidase/acylaminoacyl peptidase
VRFFREEVNMMGIVAHRKSVLSIFTAVAVVSLALTLGCNRASPPSGEVGKGNADIESNKAATAPKAAAGPAAKSAGPAPEVEVQDEDYAAARTRFQTRLVRKMPAPQPWSPIRPPAGVSEVEIPSGELRLKAWVNRPADGSGKHPAVLFLHGGFSFGKEDWDAGQPYRDAGFVVLTPILRGENGQPGSFTLWYDEVDDVLAAARYFTGQAYVDPRHLYLAGTSAGGTLALLAAEANELFRAAASFSASPDQVVLTRHAKIDLPFDKTDRRELQMRSPLAYARSFKCPVRIYYATQDNFVLTSERTAVVAKERKLDVEAVRLEGDHGSIVPEGIKRSIQFFRAR